MHIRGKHCFVKNILCVSWKNYGILKGKFFGYIRHSMQNKSVFIMKDDDVIVLTSFILLRLAAFVLAF